MLSGYKTYIAMAAMIAAALLEGLGGVDIPGVDLDTNWLTWVLEGLGISALRSGVATAAFSRSGN